MIEPEIKQIMSLGRKEQQRMLLASVTRLNRQYIVAGNRTANIVLTSKGKTLQETLFGVEQTVKELSASVSRTVQQNVTSSVNLGLSKTLDTAEIYATKVVFDMRSEEFIELSRRLTDAAETTVDGIKLSGKVWDINQVALSNMRQAIITDLIDQTPLNVTAQKMKKLLLSPNSDMRTKKWRLYFKQHPPGRGVYRSAAKNAQRVLVTESNRAYRLGTTAYSQGKDWIRSNKWNRSGSPADCPICNELATQDLYGLGSGNYPPGSAPSTPHPWCECYITIEPLDEFRVDQINVA